MHVQGLDYIKFLRERSGDLWNNPCCGIRILIGVSITPSEEIADMCKKLEAVEGVRCTNTLPVNPDIFALIEASTGPEIKKIMENVKKVDGVTKVERRPAFEMSFLG
jgi:hypothetical protein